MEARAPSADSTFENTPFPTAQHMSLKPRSYQIGAGSVKRPPRTRSLHPPTRHCRPLAGLCSGGGGKGRGAPLGCSPRDCRDGRRLPHPARPCPRGIAGSGQGSPMAYTCGWPRHEGPHYGDGKGGRGGGKGAEPLGSRAPLSQSLLELGTSAPSRAQRTFVFKQKHSSGARGKWKILVYIRHASGGSHLPQPSLWRQRGAESDSGWTWEPPRPDPCRDPSLGQGQVSPGEGVEMLETGQGAPRKNQD